MAEQNETRTWFMRTAFFVLAVFVLYWQLLPLETTPRRWTGPDLLLVLSCVWVLRRPDYAPVFLIACILLLADFLLGRPPGLLAAVVVLVTENLRRRSFTMRDMPFGVEWLTAGGALCAMIIGNRVLNAIFFVEQPSLGLSLIQLIMSVLCYPLVVLFCVVFLRIRRVGPHERDGLGARG